MSDSDFVRWEDVDLDFHLGQCTDDEMCVDSSSDSEAENRPPPKVPKKSSATCTYVCPICQKGLKTVGGFRGHVAKQHNNPHLKGWYGIYMIKDSFINLYQ